MWIRTSCSLLRTHPHQHSWQFWLRGSSATRTPLDFPIWHCTPAVQRPNMDSVKESTVTNPRKENQLVKPILNYSTRCNFLFIQFILR